MKNLIKKYWDLISGTVMGLLLSYLVGFQLEPLQVLYSVVILILVCIGVCKILKQSIEKNKAKRTQHRKDNVIDTLVDSQKPVKAVSLATDPTKEGEKIGKLILDLWRGTKKTMKKLKTFFDKFKGFMLALCLTIMSIIEMCGGFINQLLDGKLAINGVEILPIITLVCAVIIGCISNGFTKEQCEKIKALFSKSSTNELVTAEIKKTLKESNVKLTQFNKIKATKETELENLESQKESAKNTLEAKREMLNMIPQLATDEDVQLAVNDVLSIEEKIVAKKQEIIDTDTSISNLTTTINALKSQL